ncbi:hypothetical protein ACFQNE_16500 [Gordonia phosphorivorans]|uniref:Uncharacterized protein n=1 Tax=Gordonia phosphorivorans TaxID=1056982 RepID=A0ABV6HCP8_9ACTN
MSRTISRRLISVAASAAVLGGGLTGVATTTGVGTADAATCKSSSTKKYTLVVDYGFEKAVKGRAVAGGTVTYALSLSTNSAGNPYVQDVWDTPPTALKGVKPTVKVKAFTLIGGILGGGGAFGGLIEETPISPGAVKADGDRWKISHTGWAVFSSRAFTAEYTYEIPSKVLPGTKLTSGGAAFQATPKPPLGYVNMPDMTACTTVKVPNAGEAILGSMDMAGLGSSEGQLSSAGSLNDLLPGIIGGIIGGVGGGDKDKDEDKK